MPVFSIPAAREIALPSSLSYPRGPQSEEPNPYPFGNFFQTLLQKIGLLLRNAFYLPLYSQRIDPDCVLNQRLAEKITQTLKKSEILPSEEPDLVKRFFSVRDVAVRLEGPVSQTFTVRVFESKAPIGGKNLRMILFSFYGNTENRGSAEPLPWNPLTLQALGESPIFVIKALQSAGIRLDSLITTSLGNMVLDGLKNFSKEEDFKILPSTVIINRGLTSVKKVANRLYSFPFNHLLYGAARLSGWDANPERELVRFLEREKEVLPLSQRKIVWIEALEDFYFSGEGRFALDTHEKIATLGHLVFRASFYPFPFQIRTHHALSLDHFVNNAATETLKDTLPWDLCPNEKISSAIAKNVFLNGDEPDHTCFYIAGNDATLDIGTARDLLPLLSAFIEEAQKRAQTESLVDDTKQAS